jgi:hypothetical protein
MSHGENGTPDAPEWSVDPALERCIGCNKIKVACDADRHFGDKCCGWCSHSFTETPMKPPALWLGDQA